MKDTIILSYRRYFTLSSFKEKHIWGLVAVLLLSMMKPLYPGLCFLLNGFLDAKKGIIPVLPASMTHSRVWREIHYACYGDNSFPTHTLCGLHACMVPLSQLPFCHFSCLNAGNTWVFFLFALSVKRWPHGQWLLLLLFSGASQGAFPA